VKALIRACLEGYLCMFHTPRHSLFTWLFPRGIRHHRGCGWKIYLPICQGHVHICTAWLADLGGCSVRIIIVALETSSAAAEGGVARTGARPEGFPFKSGNPDAEHSREHFPLSFLRPKQVSQSETHQMQKCSNYIHYKDP
jgi:hypothetical protein